MLTPALILAATETAGAKSAGLPQLNPETIAPQLVWLIITYGLLYLALSWFILPRIGQVIDERRNRIQRDLDEAERLKRETEAAIAGYEQALAEARAKSQAIVKETRDKLSAEIEKERASVEATIEAKIADADARITAMKETAMAEVDAIASDTAGDIVTKLIGVDVTADEVRTALADAQPAE
ncbi:MAG: F0F1 ATP synthase subunit B' [Pseudomonadota bacterium]